MVIELTDDFFKWAVAQTGGRWKIIEFDGVLGNGITLVFPPENDVDIPGFYSGIPYSISYVPAFTLFIHDVIDYLNQGEMVFTEGPLFFLMHTKTGKTLKVKRKDPSLKSWMLSTVENRNRLRCLWWYYEQAKNTL